MQTVLVCGSRSWRDASVIQRRLARFPERVRVIHGDARGADKLAASIAREFGHLVEAYPADWRRHGRAAGIIRNLEMLEKKPDLVLAFWDGASTGTKHMIDAARRRDISVEVTRPHSGVGSP
jgi:acetyl-CoA carboxylase alpha subunit